MVVALGATNGLAQPHGAYGAHAISQHPGFIVLGLRPAFFGGEEQPVEGGGNFLLACAGRQQVARQLFARELIERFVPIESFDHVVAIGPDVARIIGMITDGVSEAHHVEPANCHALTKLRRGDQLFDQTRNRIRRFIPRECLNVFWLRRQPNQIKVKSPRQRPAVGW